MVKEYIHELGEVEIPYEGTLSINANDIIGHVTIGGSCGCIAVDTAMEVTQSTFFKYKITAKNIGNNEKNIYLWRDIEGQRVHLVTHVLRFN
jgi:hypothetical protein